MGKSQSAGNANLRWLGLRTPPGKPDGLVPESGDLAEAVAWISAQWEQIREQTRSASRREEAAKQVALMTRCGQQVAESWPEADSREPQLVRAWLGPRRWWLSCPLGDSRRVAIVSSRLRRQIDPHGAWLRGLRAALRHVRHQRLMLVVASGTAGSEIILRGAVRMGIPTLLLRCCASLRGETWESHWESRLQEAPNEVVVDGWALPSSDHFPAGIELPEVALSKVPERDRATVAWADDVIVLGLRPRGNLEKLVRQRLKVMPGSVLLTQLDGLQPNRLRADLIHDGAIPWFPENDESGGSEEPIGDSEEVAAAAYQIPSLGLTREWDFLTHATRACPGPWPGQSQLDFLDALLDARPDSDHSPLAALHRIITERTLHASGLAIRGGFEVVSFTAVPLAELPGMRVFRAHRGRWDFEPYGICIRRRWLEEHGGRPVCYGPVADWKHLSDADRPFFQAVGNPTTRPSKQTIDWSVEREWRHLGALSLHDLQPGDALVFVKTSEEARKLSLVSPWPVFVLPSRQLVSGAKDE